MNDTSVSTLELDCPEYGEFSEQHIQALNFWIEGVVQTTLAVPGLIGEFTTVIYIKSRRDSFL